MKTWLSPIRIMLIYLLGMAAWATINWAVMDLELWLALLRNFGLLYGASWLTFQVLTKLGLAKPTRWEHRVISCLILYLLFDSVIPWWIFPLLGVVSELLQRLVRFATGPVANPAAVGILVVGAVTGFLPTWWATNFGPRFGEMLSLAFVITVLAAGFVVHKYKKFPLVAAAALTTSLAFIVLLQTSPVFLLVDGTLIFFLMVMAVEPKTSPVILWQQLAYGAGIGLLTVIGLHWAWFEPFAIALVLCNIAFNVYRNRKALLAKFSPAQPVAAPTSTPPSPTQP